MTYLVILKSYMTSIPEALYDRQSWMAGDFTIYLRIALPVQAGWLATDGAFHRAELLERLVQRDAVSGRGQPEPVPAAILLNNILTKAQAMNAAAARSGIPASDVPSEPMKLAMTVVATGPIILFCIRSCKKYFVKGRYHRSGKKG